MIIIFGNHSGIIRQQEFPIRHGGYRIGANRHGLLEPILPVPASVGQQPLSHIFININVLLIHRKIGNPQILAGTAPLLVQHKGRDTRHVENDNPVAREITDINQPVVKQHFGHLPQTGHASICQHQITDGIHIIRNQSAAILRKLQSFRKM